RSRGLRLAVAKAGCHTPTALWSGLTAGLQPPTLEARAEGLSGSAGRGVSKQKSRPPRTTANAGLSDRRVLNQHLPDIQQCCRVLRFIEAQSRNDGKRSGRMDMDWEEALLQCWGAENASETATRYRQRAARAREMAEGATTRAVKVRLLDDAVLFDRLADQVKRNR